MMASSWAIWLPYEAGRSSSEVKRDPEPNERPVRGVSSPCIAPMLVRPVAPPHRSIAPCSTRRARYSSADTPGGSGKTGSVGRSSSSRKVHRSAMATVARSPASSSFHRRRICAPLLRYHSPLGRSRVPISSSVRSCRSDDSTSCTMRPVGRA